jgi:hypothetical protein
MQIARSTESKSRHFGFIVVRSHSFDPPPFKLTEINCYPTQQITSVLSLTLTLEEWRIHKILYVFDVLVSAVKKENLKDFFNCCKFMFPPHISYLFLVETIAVYFRTSLADLSSFLHFKTLNISQSKFLLNFCSWFVYNCDSLASPVVYLNSAPTEICAMQKISRRVLIHKRFLF